MEFKTIEDANAYIKKLIEEISAKDKKLVKFEELQKNFQEQSAQIETFKKEKSEREASINKETRLNKLKSLNVEDKHIDKVMKLMGDVELDKFEETLKGDDYNIFLKNNNLNVKINDDKEVNKENDKKSHFDKLLDNLPQQTN